MIDEVDQRFGMLLHALIERRTEGRETAGWWKLAGFHDDEYRRAAPVASRLLATEALQKFFDPTQYERAWNEVDITSGDGVLRRIDRRDQRGAAVGEHPGRQAPAVPYRFESIPC